ncbi:MAG: hypothetical protein VXU50_01790 [Verrucomicrobiota bacterium]|nr:hypothetical protein [Verrucomicrobiota bacterium]
MTPFRLTAFRRFAASQRENETPDASAGQRAAELRSRFASERVFPMLSGDRLLQFLQAEACQRGVEGIDRADLRGHSTFHILRFRVFSS